MEGQTLLDREFETLLAFTRVPGFRSIHTFPVEEARELAEQRFPRGGPRHLPDVLRRDFKLSSDVTVRLYYPRSVESSPLPVLVYLHGGGYVVGSINTHDKPCVMLADRARVAIASVGYRLAPEHKFPAALEDAIIATQWIHSSAASLGLDASRIAIGGDSSGGTIATVVAGLLQATNVHLRGQVLLYPLTSALNTSPSRREFADGYFLYEEEIQWYHQHYLPSKRLMDDPRVSPLHSEVRRLRGLPRAVVVTAGWDPVRDEGRQYAALLQQAGVSVIHREFGQLLHGFVTAGGTASARRAIEEVAHLIDQVLR